MTMVRTDRKKDLDKPELSVYSTAVYRTMVRTDKSYFHINPWRNLF